MGTLRTLQLIGTIAKIVGGAATAGVGIVEFKNIMAESRPALEVKNDPVDLSGDFNEVDD